MKGRVKPGGILFIAFALLCVVERGWRAQCGEAPPAEVAARVVVVQGKVEVAAAGSEEWRPARVDQELRVGDKLHTGRRARAQIRYADKSVVAIFADSILIIQAPERAGSQATLDLPRGSFFMHSRERPDYIRFRTRLASGAVRGTEVHFRVAGDGQTTVAVFDGEVYLANSAGEVSVFGGEIAEVKEGLAPRKTALLEARNILQWVLYYPAVLHPPELFQGSVVPEDLRASLAAYRRGNLLEALAAFPATAPREADRTRVYHAALLLAVGQVDEALGQLDATRDSDPAVRRNAQAVRQLIAAVKLEPFEAAYAPSSASEWMARSYEEQARGRLEAALEAARKANELAPDFGFARVRCAELEFSFGRVREAEAHLAKGLELSPENAQAKALQGYLLSARNRVREAQEEFEAALGLDSALGSAWLGRGLCRIRRGDLEGGRHDLQTAVALEPQRAMLRSYLGKAFSQGGEAALAVKELDLAKELDPNDPTAWLYSALLNQRENRINQAVDDLEQSTVRNDNRRLYRSRLLLDQDRAVRGANLANVYEDAGMSAVAFREATRAVDADYANAAAHLFLANSYNALRDPRQVSLRYESPWFSEFLLANLLSPVGAGVLSQTVSQNEYSRLFERNRFGVVSDTLYTSNGDWMQSGAQYGIFGKFEYALDALYRSEVGQRANQDLEQLNLSFQTKIQVSPSDTIWLQGVYYDADSGDLAQYYDPGLANPAMRVHERHEPVVLAGWHHEWKPGVHTLFLGSPWVARTEVTDPLYEVLWGAYRSSDGSVFAEPVSAPLEYGTEFPGWSAELQQIVQFQRHTLIGGLRYQAGSFDSSAAMDVSDIYSPPSGGALVADFGAEPGMERFSVYAYDQWRVFPWALLSLGLSYDWLTTPVNFTTPPLSAEEDNLDQVSPKIGLTLTPWKGGVVRGAYSRSLGGASFDQSYRLEPVQVAGFTQTLRGLMPESIVGLVPGQDMQNWGGLIEQKLPSRTYLAVRALWAESDADRGVGAFLYDGNAGATLPSTLENVLAFRERTVLATANQLVGEWVALGVGYRWNEAALDSAFPLVTRGELDQAQRSVLHQVALTARFNHPAGFFADWESVWNHQTNYGDGSAARPGDDVWQHNLWAGWRFYRRRAELAVGILNLTDTDYRLHPLNYYLETYRQRTLAISARFNF